MIASQAPDHHDLLTATEVSRLFGVDPKTVTRWARAGKLPASFRTLGGHRRWRRDEIEATIAARSGEASDG